MRGLADASASVQQVEQARGGFDEVAGGLRRRIARDRAEADQIFAVAALAALSRSGLDGA